jgi:hypothetical protein
MAGPAAVRTVTFRITVARDANGRYVLGKGFALGTDSAPLSRFAVRAALSGRGCWAAAGACDVDCGVEVVCVVRVADEQPTEIASSPTPNDRNLMM